jgi:hypothetical protein
MIDISAPAGAFAEERVAVLLQRLVEALLVWTGASEIPFVRRNAGAYFHVLPPAYVTAGGVPDIVVRIDVVLPEVALSTLERRRGFIAEATQIVAALRRNSSARRWLR